MIHPGSSLTFTAAPDDIDQLGHVNNAVWVRWIQAVAEHNWFAHARPEDAERYLWMVMRHEIDYRGNMKEGESVIARTWVGEPRGSRFDRHVAFSRPEGGRPIVEAKTTWVIIEKDSGRVARLSPEIAAPFLAVKSEN